MANNDEDQYHEIKPTYTSEIGKNIVAGAGDFAGGLYNMVRHPINTVTSLYDQAKDFANTPEDSEANWQGNLLHVAEHAPIIGPYVKQAETGGPVAFNPQSVGAGVRAAISLGVAPEALKALPDTVRTITSRPVMAPIVRGGLKLAQNIGDRTRTFTDFTNKSVGIPSWAVESGIGAVLGPHIGISPWAGAGLTPVITTLAKVGLNKAGPALENYASPMNDFFTNPPKSPTFLNKITPSSGVVATAGKMGVNQQLPTKSDEDQYHEIYPIEDQYHEIH